MFDVNIAIMKMEFKQQPANLDSCKESYPELDFIWDYIDASVELTETHKEEILNLNDEVESLRSDIEDTLNE